MATHQLPGFAPAVVAREVQLSANSAVMAVHAHFDNGEAGLLLAAYLCQRVITAREWPRVVGIGLAAGFGSAVCAIGFVVATGTLHFDPKLPSIAPAWLAISLFLTCLLEEAFFRGLVQDRLAAALPLRWGAGREAAAIAAASALFGLAHIGGGHILIAAAAIAGVGYGLAYAATRRIEAAVVAHFTLNSIHFFAFTYPYAAR
jgi:hypothetical protein